MKILGWFILIVMIFSVIIWNIDPETPKPMPPPRQLTQAEVTEAYNAKLIQDQIDAETAQHNREWLAFYTEVGNRLFDKSEPQPSITTINVEVNTVISQPAPNWNYYPRPQLYPIRSNFIDRRFHR